MTKLIQELEAQGVEEEKLRHYREQVNDLFMHVE